MEQSSMQQPVSQKTITSLVILLILFGFSLMIKNILLDNTEVISLKTAPPLTGVVSQSLLTNATVQPLIAGKDYTWSAVYFDNNTWAVGRLGPINKLSSDINPGIVVFEKIDGTFQVVLGPTSAMPNSQLLSMPTDVANYVKSNVAVYTPVPD
jgi:hypothetical protein